MQIYYNESLQREIEPAAGETVLQALSRSGFTLAAPCGGMGRCGKCTAKIDSDFPLAPAEQELLSPAQKSGGIRLTCCVPAEKAHRVYLLRDNGAQVVTQGHSAMPITDPRFYARSIELSPASADTPLSDESRLKNAAGLELSPQALADLPDILAQTGGRCWILCAENQILSVHAEKPVPVALSFDIGTTTVAGYLTHAESGEILAQHGALSDQRNYGADVISRAQHAQQPEGLQALTDAIRSQIQKMTQQLMDNFQNRPIVGYSFAGNPVMMHLLLGVNPAQIAKAPFTPVFSDAKILPASHFGFKQQCAVWVLPGVSGYVGADTVAAVLASSMQEKEQTALLLDIGTNGEIVLKHQGKLFACSAAAGPAFEGAHIACGMAGTQGAICKVTDNVVIRYETIGGQKPAGLCGSGLLDAVRVLLARGVIDASGAFDEEGPGICEEEDELRCYLAPNVYLTQGDIRQVQLAKAAIAAGVQALMRLAGITQDNLDQVYLAGGFGSHLNPESAMALGLLPNIGTEKILVLGNGAGSGARLALLDRACWAKAKEIAEKMQYVELSLRKDFTELFVENMLFEI